MLSLWGSLAGESSLLVASNAVCFLDSRGQSVSLWRVNTKPRFYLRSTLTGLFFRVRLGGVNYWTEYTGGNGYDGNAEGWDTEAEAEQSRKSLDLFHLETVEI